MLLTIIAVTTLLSITTWAKECPLPEVVFPCFCRGEPSELRIECKNTTVSGVQSVLTRILANRRTDKHFDVLTIEANESWTEIPDNFTGGLTFSTVSIVNVYNGDIFDVKKPMSSIRVHSSAFQSTASQIRRFSLGGFNVSIGPGSYDIFKAINSFSNVKQIDLHGVSSIPKSAFKSLAKLEKLGILGPAEPLINPIAGQPAIGEDAFYQLKNLKELSLDSDSLPSNVLRFQNSSETINIHFSGNLNQSFHSIRSLDQMNRPARLSLNTCVNIFQGYEKGWGYCLSSSNYIRFLPETIFRPFLDAHRLNYLSLANTRFNCSDCGNAWLVKHQPKYRAKISGTGCEDNNKNLFDRNFDHCKS